jgi:putative tryptophan/tyrosine transport system substrate-binding protein
MKRRDVLRVLGGAAMSWPVGARAQQAGKVHRIGFLANDPKIATDATGAAFLEGLRENGFVEGQNIIIERRFTAGRNDRAPELVAELRQLKVELIAVSGTAGTLAAKRATTSIPVVMLNAIDPVGSGVIPSLAHPGGNITGLTSHASLEISAKRLGLLKEAVPSISRVAVLKHPDNEYELNQWNVIERAAQALGITAEPVTVRSAAQFEEAFATVRQSHPDGLIATFNALNLVYRKEIAQFAASERLPAMYPFIENAEAGGLMAYGHNRPDLYRRGASYVAKILNGARPADLPVEQPTKFELVINLRTAKAIGLEIPPMLLARADEVIE